MIERLYTECPKCGARGGCAKHGLSPTGIDQRARGLRNAASRDAQWDGNPKGEDPEGLRAKHDSPVPEGDAP